VTNAKDSPRTLFDAAYYRRFYRDRPVHDRRAIGHLAAGVLGFCDWWGMPVRAVLDVGAGTGMWRDWLARHRPRVRYRSIDISEYACERYGHEFADISTWRAARPSDLVVCQGVLQYVDDRACSAAIENLAAATSGVLYLEVPTMADRTNVLDLDTTDLDIHWRTGAWYRRRLEPAFMAVGCGLFAARSAGVNFYELEVGRAR
jgi:trans-aconitate methyltransferase